METNSKKPLLALPLLAALALPFAIVCVRYGGWRFLLFLLFWVLLPGRLLTARILRLQLPSRGAGLLVSFFIGAAQLFAQFYLLYALGLLSWLPFVSPLLCVLYGAYRWRKKPAGQSAPRKLPAPKTLLARLWAQWPLLLLWAAVLWLTVYTLNAAMPAMTDLLHPDYIWHVSITDQFASARPFNDIHVDGNLFRYHYFQDLFLGMAKRIFGGEGWVYVVQYAVLYEPLLLVLGLYSLARLVTPDRRAAALSSLFCLVGSAWDCAYSNWYISWVSNVNAVALGCACIAALFHVTLPVLRGGLSGPQYARHTAAAAALTAVLTGWKGPFALVYVAALAVYTLLQTVKNRRPDRRGILLLGCLAAVFALVYSLLLFGISGRYVPAWQDVWHNLLLAANRGGLPAWIYSHYGEGSRARWFILPLSLLGTFTLYAPVLFLWLWQGARWLFGRGRMEPAQLFAGLLAWAAVSAYYLFPLQNWNNKYFLFAGLPFLALVGLAAWQRIRWPAARGVLAAAAALLILHGLPAMQDPRMITRPPSAVADYVLGRAQPADAAAQQACEAFLYLRRETPPDCLLATNRQGDNGADFRLAAFAERRCYLDGYAYSEPTADFPLQRMEQRRQEMADLFGTGWSGAEKAAFARQHGIDYLVAFAGEESCAVPPDGPDFETVFSNDAVTVCRVLPA